MRILRIRHSHFKVDHHFNINQNKQANGRMANGREAWRMGEWANGREAWRMGEWANGCEAWRMGEWRMAANSPIRVLLWYIPRFGANVGAGAGIGLFPNVGDDQRLSNGEDI